MLFLQRKMHVQHVTQYISETENSHYNIHESRIQKMWHKYVTINKFDESFWILFFYIIKWIFEAINCHKLLFLEVYYFANTILVLFWKIHKALKLVLNEICFSLYLHIMMVSDISQQGQMWIIRTLQVDFNLCAVAILITMKEYVS